MFRFASCFLLMLLGLLAAGCNTGGQPPSSEKDASKDGKPTTGGDSSEKKDAPKSDQEAIQGAWIVISAEENGLPIKGKGDRQSFSAEEMTIGSENKNDNVKATYKLDPAKSPKEILIRITVESKEFGKVDTFAKGIYQLDNDELKICWGSQGAEGPIPKEFKTEFGSKHKLFVFKREKP